MSSAVATTPLYKKKWLILLAMCLAQGTAFTDQTAIGIAQPSIQASFNISSVTVLWIINTYLLTVAILIGIGGRLSDFWPYKRVYGLGMAIFILGAFYCALTTPFNHLIIGRIIQGIGMALAIPNTILITIRSFPPQDKGKAMGMLLGGTLLYLLLGLALATSLSELIGWRFIFWQGSVSAFISLIIAYYTIEEQVVSRKKITLQGSILLYALGIGMIVFALMQINDLSSQLFILLCSMAFIFLWLFYYMEKHRVDPLIDFYLFKNKLFVCAIVLGFCITAAMNLFAFDTIYYQSVLDFSPFICSLLFFPNILCQIIAAPVGGILYDKFGYQRPVILGSLAVMLGLSMNAGVVYLQNYWLLIPGIFLINIGTPFISAAIRTIAISSVVPGQQGAAAGIFNITDMLSGSITLAFLTALITHYNQSSLQHFLTTHTAYQFLSLAEFEKVLNMPLSTSTSNLNLPQMHALNAAAELAYTSAYSKSLIACTIILALGFIFALYTFKKKPTS